jgi:hypothetical protein
MQGCTAFSNPHGFMEVTLLALRIVLVILLYAFLGLIVILLWRDVRSAATTEATPATREWPARLVVVDELDSVQAGAAFSLRPYTTIGRAPANHIEIADSYCSAEHALVLWRNGQWWIEDRDSRNGTQLNGEIIGAATVLSPGDVIRIGRAQLRFEADTL